jgi:MFS family permease
VHALVLGTWAPRIPAITQRVGIDAGQLGIALTAMALAFVVGARLASYPVARFGSGAVTRASAVVVSLALLGPAFAGNLMALTAGLVALGAAGGVLDVAMNLQAVLVERRYGRPLMSGIHALWSVGSMAGALVGVAAAKGGVGVGVHFTVVGLVLGAASWLALRGSTEPRSTEPAEDGPAGREGSHMRWWRWSLPAIGLFLGLLGFCSFLAEGSSADWSALYLRDVSGASVAVASAGFAVFEGAMALVRFGGNRLVSRFGPVAVVRVGALAAAAGLTLALAAPRPALTLVGLAAFGAGVGPVVPIVFSAAGSVRGTSEGAVLSAVVSMSYMGSILGPLAIGLVASFASLHVGMVIPLALVLVIAAGAPFVSSAAGRPPPAHPTV